MRRFTATLLAVGLTLGACGGGDDSALTSEEREWCTLADASEESASKFDLIFERGLFLGIDMDSINAFADQALTGYEAEGMTADQAVRAVSNELLDNEGYIAACKLAYSDK